MNDAGRATWEAAPNAAPPTERMAEEMAELAAELAQTRLELQRVERRFASAFGHQFQFMAILDPDGRVVDFNEQMAPGPALPREEVLGQLFWKTRWWADQPAMQAAWPQRLQAAAQSGEPLCSEDTFTSSTGEARVARASVHAVHDGDGRLDCFIVQATDITERRRAEADRAALEASLHEAQKLQAIGTLAGGIAHDFNNILGAILGHAALAVDAIGEQHPALAPLAQIQRAGSRARSLVRQILTFSRRQTPQLRAQPLQPLIEETLALLASLLPAAEVELQARLATPPLWVRCDETQVQQVLMNLCTNAWHALPDGRGRIEVGLAPAASGQVHLWVADNGCGIDAATRTRMFEPFFTTKAVHLGTGLGLSVVHGIVLEHGGRLEVDSQVGEGSVFHIHLPGVEPIDADVARNLAESSRQVAQADAAAARASLSAALPEAHGRRVLYLDDDEVMVGLAEQLLQRAGYQVSVFLDPEQALAALRATPAGFDALVTDFNMPGRNGLDVVRELATIAPDLPVVMTSGYIDEALRSEARRLGVRQLLHKENTLDDLCRLLQQALAVV